MFEHKPAANPEPRASFCGEPAVKVQTVLAAIQRLPWIVIAYFRLQGPDLRARDVRRDAGDEIKAHPGRQGVEAIARVQEDTLRQSKWQHILTGHFQRRLGNVDGMNFYARTLRRDGQCQATAAGAEVQNHRRGCRGSRSIFSLSPAV